MYFSKPNIVISKCLNFENCRYNWEKINDNFLVKLWNFVNFIPVCPEVWIWLWVPRLPLRLVKTKDWELLYQPSTKTDFTKKMNDFWEVFLSWLQEIDGFILKNRSPSCWIWDVKVYDKIDFYSFSSNKWMWIFTKKIDTLFPLIPKEDEWRLKNFLIREDFLTKIFALADFREVKYSNKISALVKFQSKNKYLFMSYSPSLQVELWHIIASYNKKNLEEIFINYEENLKKLFDTKKSIWKKINAFTHIFWYFKNSCSSNEKEFFKETIYLYKEWRIPTSSVINILKTWALRDDISYILEQTILSPFPTSLLELSDSGKILEL